VQIRWRKGNFLESQLLAIRVKEVVCPRNNGIIRLVVASVRSWMALRKRTYLAPDFEPELQRDLMSQMTLENSE